jgi:hypothetical protein
MRDGISKLLKPLCQELSDGPPELPVSACGVLLIDARAFLHAAINDKTICGVLLSHAGNPTNLSATEVGKIAIALAQRVKAELLLAERMAIPRLV